MDSGGRAGRCGEGERECKVHQDKDAKQCAAKLCGKSEWGGGAGRSYGEEPGEQGSKVNRGEEESEREGGTKDVG